MTRALTGLCGVVLDLEPPDAEQLARRVDTFTSSLPTTARAALRAGTAALDATAVLMVHRRLDQLDATRRQVLIDHLERHALGGQLIDLLKVPVLLGAAGGSPPLRALAGAGSRPVRPDADLDVTPSRHWPTCTTADVVVVGSGAGGAMAASILANAGLTTVVLEEGRRFTVDEFAAAGALERFSALYRDGGATVAIGRPPVVLPIGRGIGGTTLVNSGTCYKTPHRVLERWRDTEGVGLADPSVFDTHLDTVEQMLRVAPVPDPVMGHNGRLALAGAAALGWSAHRLRRNAPGCGGCCQCAVGCPRNAKFGVHLNALPDACRAGARIVSHARVERILHERGRATGVHARRPDGSPLEILAPRIVVAAGSTETPPLLRRSGLGHHPQLGRNLAVHPALSVAGRFEETVHPTSGVLQSVGIDEFHHSEGILIEATATPPGMGSMVLPGAGQKLVQHLRQAEHLATLGAMIADAPGGWVRGARRSIIGYNLDRCDQRRLVRSIELMGQVLFAAGARAVFTGVRGHDVVQSTQALHEAVEHAVPARLHLAAFHPTGTARMGADAGRHPVDTHGQLRGIRGVWIADGSVLPSCPEVNPQVTIMALALAIGTGIVAQ